MHSSRVWRPPSSAFDANSIQQLLGAETVPNRLTGSEHLFPMHTRERASSPGRLEDLPKSAPNGLPQNELAHLEAMINELSLSRRAIPLFALKNDPDLCDVRLFQDRSLTSYVIGKRAIDLAVTLIMGLMCLPFLPLLALAIKLDSPGPVFFAQTRVGRYGKPFTIYKLRSMTHLAPPSGPLMTTLPNDPRVTKVGRVIRKTRIDEIPQLWNVVRGEMSLIGPRPELPASSEYLSELLPGFKFRMQVRPGVTGWAQVLVGYADSLDKHQRRLEHDLYYVRYHSFSMDFEVARRTLRVMITSKGH